MLRLEGVEFTVLRELFQFFLYNVGRGLQGN